MITDEQLVVALKKLPSVTDETRRFFWENRRKMRSFRDDYDDEQIGFLTLRYVLKSYPELFPHFSFNSDAEIAAFITGKPLRCNDGGDRKFDPTTFKLRTFCGTINKCSCAMADFKKNTRDQYHDNRERRKIASNKREATNITKYGAKSPLESKQIIEKIHQTNLKRYGDVHHLNNTEIQTKIKESMSKKYGVEYNSQIRISTETLSLLQDKEKLTNALNKSNIISLADEHGIDRTTIVNWIQKHNIERNTSRSSYENEIAFFLKQHDIVFVANDRKTINPFEIDFLLKENRLAIEFNGIYWHSKHDQSYHVNKHQLITQAGYRPIFIHEDEWAKNSEAIKLKILNLCGKSTRGVGARKLNVHEIDTATAYRFFEKHHIQGKAVSQKAVGLYEENKLVVAMSFSKQRTTGIWELNRYCSDGKIYCGSFSKLFKYFVNNNTDIDTILSFADCRYSLGEVYARNGFDLIERIKPDYRYTYGNKTYHKSSFTKTKIEKKFGITEGTERLIMESLGYFRLYDCGKLKYKWNR